jgi:nucleoid-associated protein YgaU
MAKSPFVKAKIEAPRKRIPVDEALRAEARAGMGGEQTRLEAEVKPTVPAAPALTEAVAASAAVASAEPTPAPVPAPAVQVVPEPTPAPAAPYVAPAPVERRPRGRKPAAADAEPAGELKGVRIAESVWSEIRKIIVQLPKGPDMPTNIIGYIHAAHRHYEAHLRKQGKLPAAN